MNRHGADVESRLRTSVLFAGSFFAIQMLLPQAGAQAANVPRHLPAAKSANTTSASTHVKQEARPDANALTAAVGGLLGAFEHHLRMMIAQEGRNGTVELELGVGGCHRPARTEV